MPNVTMALLSAAVVIGTHGGQSIAIDLAHGTERERATRTRLEQVLAQYDVNKYTFTRHVIIEERAINHAFPVLTMNARFADSSDELLSLYVYEQLHWYSLVLR